MKPKRSTFLPMELTSDGNRKIDFGLLVPWLIITLLSLLLLTITIIGKMG